MPDNELCRATFEVIYDTAYEVERIPVNRLVNQAAYFNSTGKKDYAGTHPHPLWALANPVFVETHEEDLAAIRERAKNFLDGVLRLAGDSVPPQKAFDYAREELEDLTAFIRDTAFKRYVNCACNGQDAPR